MVRKGKETRYAYSDPEKDSVIKDLGKEGKEILIVEDIIDSGLTLSYLRRNLWSRNPASLEVCALLVREGLQREELDLRYTGFTIPPEFVVGYGLDAGERFRNLPDVRAYRGGVGGAE